MSKDAPAPPDYQAAAEAQGEASREVTEQQTWANRPTINTPFGQQTWEVTPVWDPSTGQYLNTWTQNTNLTPESQEALDSQLAVQSGRSQLAENMLGRAQDEYGEAMDWSQFTDLSDPLSSESLVRGLDSSERYYDDAGNAIFNQFASRAEPQFTRDTEALRTQLYNQGLREGDEAFDREVDRLRESQNDARRQASYQATIGAGQEASRMFGMDRDAGAFANTAAQQALGQNMSVANFRNTLRQQEIAEEMQRRGFSLNEINAVLTGQQVGMPSMPGFQNASKSEGVQYLQAAGMQGQAALDAFNAEQAGTQGMMSGIMGGAMMFSDRRLKKGVKKLWKDLKGIQWYLYRYFWDSPETHRVGVMAQEVMHIPGAVRIHSSGYLMVDYGRIN